MKSKIASWLTLITLISTGVVSAQTDSTTTPWQTYGTENGEWRSYAGDIGGRKYSALDQIDADNFNDLEIVWEWMSVDNFVSRSTPGGGEWWAPLDTIVDTLVEDTPDLYRTSQPPNPSRLQVTPLMIDGTLYFNTPLSQGVAVDAKTGQTLWIFNPKGYEEGTPSMSGPWTQRGVAYWTDGIDDERIFWGTGNGYVVCVKAKTGQPCQDFGLNGSGMVDAMVGVPRVERESRDYLNALLYSINSPPIVVRDKVIHGSQIADRRITKEAPPGWVRAWDVRTGEHAWDFHTVPNSTDEFGVDTWLNDSWRYSGNANVWSMLAGDSELGHVYLPTGTTTNDFYGGDRLGDNLFSETLIAVDVETGERVWHFQAVHHGLWDYDFPTHPNLVDITVDGRAIKAIAQVSKQGFVYTFDRVTGEPVWPIEERPVPQSKVPGEASWPTQPFPTKPAPFGAQGATEDDLIDFTPELRARALALVKPFRLGPIFTPPSMPTPGPNGKIGTLTRPGIWGSGNWHTGAFDPESGYYYAVSHQLPDVHSITSAKRPEATMMYVGRSDLSTAVPTIDGLPIFKPPYGRITAIDMNRGEHVWMAANGDGPREHPLLKELDVGPLGISGRAAPLVTKTLLFIGEGSDAVIGTTGSGLNFRAYNKATGDVIWTKELDAGTTGAPMTYLHEGKQYIIVAIGGDGREAEWVAMGLN